MQGLLLLDKPENKTSYGAVACVKRIAGEKRVGHTGTLDPMATGVLPVLLGRATALSSYLLDADKCYHATIRLGVATDTCDITGNITARKDVSTREPELQEVLSRFCGIQQQIPPMFSALKKDGVRLYSLAREGKTVDIPAREIRIYSIDQTSPLDENHEFSIDVRVSKGTYIRSLCRDIGEALGCGAVLTALRRTQTSGFDISQCVPLDVLNTDNFTEYLLCEETVVQDFPAITVTEKQAIRFCNGGQLSFDRLRPSEFGDGELYRIKCGEVFLGLGLTDCPNGQMSVRCVINDFR